MTFLRVCALFYLAISHCIISFDGYINKKAKDVAKYCDYMCYKIEKLNKYN